MKKLSVSAQTVLDAVAKAQFGSCYTQFESIAAAALRAAIDQVVPEYRENRPKTFDEEHRKMDASVIRYCLLDIADELEAMAN